MTDFWGIAKEYGLTIAMLILAVVALYTDLVVSGARYRRIERERDALLRILVGQARNSARTADAVVSTASVAERAVAALVAQHGGEADDAGMAS